jgi:rhodanese-related sulfurtransferase
MPYACPSPVRIALVAAVAAACLIVPRVASAQGPPNYTIFQTSLNEAGQPSPELTTEQLQNALKAGVPVLDVRAEIEYAISHIPGAINIPEREVDDIVARFGPHDLFILTCNGPFCGKSKRVSTDLKARGYDNFYRYQLGLPVWRALGNTVQTDYDGLAYIFNRDETAVFVDARSPEAFRAETITCAVNIGPGEAEAANNDGRLPLLDKGARVVVFADDPALAKQVAIEIARKAYWSSSYFGGTFADLKNQAQLAIHAARRCREGIK